MTMKPKVVSDATLAFPASIQEYLPPRKDIPDGFDTLSNPWVKWQSDWFFNGLSSRPTPKAGIDLDTAMRHLGVIQGTRSIKHEYKMAAVAYLASLWFEKP